MPDDESSDLFPELVAAVPPTLMAPTAPVISIQAAASDRHSASRPARSAPLPPSGQLILGADKRNPLLTVYHDGEHQQLLVYYGFEIIEIVPEDTQAGSYKLLLGRLDHSGVKFCSLCETFTLDPKTLGRSGRALQSSLEERVRLLRGRSVARPQPAVLSFLPQDPQPSNYGCEHAEVLIFAALLGPFRRSVETPRTSSPNGSRHSGWEQPISNRPSSSIGRIWN